VLTKSEFFKKLSDLQFLFLSLIAHFVEILLGEHVIAKVAFSPPVIDENGHPDKEKQSYRSSNAELAQGIIFLPNIEAKNYPSNDYHKEY
jgi:hypothetical protein